MSGFDDPPALLRSGEPDAGWTDIPSFGESRDRGVGVLEMARAIRAGRPPRASGELAYHVLDVTLAIEESVATGRPVAVDSSAPAVPAPEAGWSAAAATLESAR